MTQKETAGLYRSLASGAEAVESVLADSIIEHLASEICLGTVTSLATAMEWLQSTFLYIRMSRNPVRYRVPIAGIAAGTAVATAAALRTHLRNLITQHLFDLAAAKAVQLTIEAPASSCTAGLDAACDAATLTDFKPASVAELRAQADDRLKVTPRAPAHIMTRHYLRFSTLQAFARVPADAKEEDALRVLCEAPEVRGDVILRRDEKRARTLGRVCGACEQSWLGLCVPCPTCRQAALTLHCCLAPLPERVTRPC